MELNEYQLRAAETAIYPENTRIIYPLLELGNEAGEVQGVYKKILRDDGGVLTDETRQKLKKELGDVFWALALSARDVGLTLEEIAVANLEKLASRKARGVLQGSGDNR